MSRLLASPGYQQPWYSLCRIGWSLSYKRKCFNYLCRMFMFPLKKSFSTQRVNISTNSCHGQIQITEKPLPDKLPHAGFLWVHHNIYVGEYGDIIYTSKWVFLGQQANEHIAFVLRQQNVAINPAMVCTFISCPGPESLSGSFLLHNIIDIFIHLSTCDKIFHGRTNTSTVAVATALIRVLVWSWTDDC